jgi:2-oxoglutarate ferredoxin oxidoreductase subunit alpha
MDQRINDFSMTIATVNGSGSQSANNILMRSIFRMGVPVSGKNLFPSNIAGLPTWFSIRVNEKGYVARQKKADLVVAMNKDTFAEDVSRLKDGGLFFYNSGLRGVEPPQGVESIGIDFNALSKDVTDSIQLKKLLVNMIYVGVLTEIMSLPEEVVDATIEHQFKGKEKVFDINKKAVRVGREYVRSELTGRTWPYKVEQRELTQNKILIDGNTSGALGLVYGGCTFGAWYPITPSSSLAESFELYSHHLRTEATGSKRFSMVQAEDELSAITMVAGAGWAGSRAMTTTSGPGISLMAETIGLMYFAEIPGVIWDVQRMGPSTGLPTRTSQGDILAAARCSHGDTKHPVLLPASPAECFEMAQVALDLSEEAQTPVFVLSDLDVGMNFWMSERFTAPTEDFKRGKVLDKAALEQVGEFARYADRDGDGIPYRTLPGTEHDGAAYFTRGTGHTPEAKYSEDSDNYQALMDRLQKKWETMKTMVPAPEVRQQAGATVGVLYYGSTDIIMEELLSFFSDETVSTLRLKAYPFHKEVDRFLQNHERVLVIEQNQHGQMAELLRADYPQCANKIVTETNCDGMPLCPEVVAENIQQGGYFGHK